MKICEYCDTKNPNDALRCTSCGGVSFRQVCENCGTEFKEGVFCPFCGVKVGQKPHRCPRCRTTFYSNACPSCGYVPGGTKAVNQWAPERRKNIALWVLGWIFIFPVPLSIIIVRSEKFVQWVKVVLVIGVWLLYFLLALIGKQSEANEQNVVPVTPAAQVCCTESLPADFALIH